ncbi:hypothetical protein KAR91_61915 [Candidatus Pacearchaeota archaeon]|nr:hypothetical protein [Candidatus Pacearchaeota archaeon]
MAKLTDRTLATVLTIDDLLHVVQDILTTPVSRKMKLSLLITFLETYFARVYSEKIGLGTITPIADLHILRDRADIQLEDTADSYILIQDVTETRGVLEKVVKVGAGIMDMSVSPLDGASAALFRFFRNTNTTSDVSLQIHLGDGSFIKNHAFYGKGEDSYMCSNNGLLGIGHDSPTALTDIAASILDRASMRIRNGVAPTSPNIGDMWSEVDKLQYRKNGSETINLLSSSAPENIVYINSDSDFPTAIGGLTTLLDGKVYIITSDFSTARRFQTPATGKAVIQGHSLRTTLTLTNTSLLFNTNGTGSWTIQFLSLLANGIGSTLFNINGGSPCSLTYFFILQAENIGTIENVLLHMNACLINNFKTGLIIKGSGGSTASFSTNQVTMQNGQNVVGAKIVSFEGDLSSIRFVNSTLRTQSNEAGIYIDPASTGGGVISGVDVFGDGITFAPGSKDQTSVDWEVVACTNIPSSTVSTEMSLSNNALTTNIPVVGANVILNATTWISKFDERMTTDNNGTITYIDSEFVKLKTSGNIEFEPVTATKTLRAQFAALCCVDNVVTFTNATNVVNEISTPRVNGELVSFKRSAGTMPAGLRKDILYYIVNKTTDTFQLSSILGGSAIAFTDDGTPINSYAITDLIGTPGRATVAAGSPVDVLPKAIFEFDAANCQLIVVVRNDTDGVDIKSANGYLNVVKLS